MWTLASPRGLAKWLAKCPHNRVLASVLLDTDGFSGVFVHTKMLLWVLTREGGGAESHENSQCMYECRFSIV